MKIGKKSVKAKAVKFEVFDGKKSVGRIFLYLVYNGLHKRPYGFLEDLFVEEEYRSQGLGTSLIKAAIKEAKKLKSYKILATSRMERQKIHDYYERLGFKKYGFEFRMELK